MLNYLKKPLQCSKEPNFGFEIRTEKERKKAATRPLIFRLPTKIQLLDNGPVTSDVNLFEVIQ